MLIASTIIPTANIQLSKDIDALVDMELYGINKCPKPFSHVFAEFLLLSALGNSTLTSAQEQCFLSKLQTLK